MLVLGIETSCDETACGIVTDQGAGQARVLAHVVATQFDEHRPYGGVVPEIAARAHLGKIDEVVRRALSDANVTLDQIDGIAATCGPGLIGGVMVGAMTGKALAAVSGKPFIAINHLEAHALTARLTHDVPFPYLLLLVSGGHCQLALAEGVGRFRRLGTTLDDAVGECFDKSAKLLGLGYPGGPLLEKAAAGGNPKAFDLPRPMMGREGCDFSFSGLKTAVRLAVDAQKKIIPSSEDDAWCETKTTPSFRRPVAPKLRSSVGGKPESSCAASAAQESLLPRGRSALDPAFQRDDACVRDNKTPKPLSETFVANMAASLQAAIAAILVDRTRHAFKAVEGISDNNPVTPAKAGVPFVLTSKRDPRFALSPAARAAGRGRGDDEKELSQPVTALVVGGGVAANEAIRTALTALAAENGVPFLAPPVSLCTDNGVMIAWAGLERLRLGLTDGLDFRARPRWPLDEMKKETA
ncbi:MAG: tRNA (adenosine(37)-N6)-threonylcarbamoyltransferase complex transferase subunit TsaD [Bdellovibrionales bacterium]